MNKNWVFCAFMSLCLLFSLFFSLSNGMVIAARGIPISQGIDNKEKASRNWNMLEEVEGEPPKIDILSPENKTYMEKSVPLKLHVQVRTVNESISWMGYSLDGGENVSITGNTTLDGLSDGSHSVTVYANDTAGNIGCSDTVHFTVNAKPPIIEILSPREEKTYFTSTVRLTFTVDWTNNTASWTGYSLQREGHYVEQNVTVSRLPAEQYNATLEDLSDGWHIVTVYANDTDGRMASSDVKFRIWLIVLFQDFNDEETGDCPEGWEFTYLGYGGLVVDESIYYGDEGKSAKFWDNSTEGFPEPYRNFGAQDATIVVSFALRLITLENASLAVYVDNGNFAGANINFTRSGTIEYENDAGHHFLRTYSPEKWYMIKMIIKIPQNTYNIYINDRLEAKMVQFNNFGEAGETNRIIFKGAKSAQPIGYIDEIMIKKRIYVPDDFPTIQEAVKNANPGNIIVARENRTYYESIQFQNKTNLTLVGEKRSTTIIDGVHNKLGENIISLDKRSSNITIKDFTIRNSGGYGIYVEGKMNTITGNKIINNEYGVGCSCEAKNNIIYHNRFVCNTQQAYDNGTNTWDNDYPSGGNYWSDHKCTDEWEGPPPCPQPGRDGICDQPYNVGSVNDRFPLFLIQKIFENQMERYKLKPIPESEEPSYENPVIIKADTLKGMGVEVDLACLYFKKESENTWNYQEMEISDDTLTGEIPAFPYGITIQYYINVSNICGVWIKSATLSYTVTDKKPPVISRVRAEGNPALAIVNVTAEVKEPRNASEVREVQLRWKIYIGWNEVEMEEIKTDHWKATIQVIPGTTIEYRIRAFDRAGNNCTYPPLSRDPAKYQLKSFAVMRFENSTTGEEIRALNFSIMSEGKESTKEFNVTNRGQRTLNWSISWGASWISVDREEGSLKPSKSQKIEVTVDTTGLLPSLHVGELTVCNKTMTSDGNKTLYVYVAVRGVVIDDSWTSARRGHCDVGSKQRICFHAIWGHTALPVKNGSITVTSYFENDTVIKEYENLPINETGWISFTDSLSTVIKSIYNVTSVDCNGVTSFKQWVESPSIVWDRVDVKLIVPDNRIDVNTSVTVTINSTYEFDGTAFNGSITLNNAQRRYSIPCKKCYTVESISDPLYGLTKFKCDTVCCIWDRIEVVGGGIQMGQVDSMKTVTVWFVAVYEYDGEIFCETKGSFWVNSSVDSVGWDEHKMSTHNYRWECVYPYGKGNRTFKASRINDTQYGLTALHDTVGPLCTDQASFHSSLGDVTITRIEPSTTKVDVGDPVDVDVYVFNKGGDTSTFYVNLYSGSKLIESKLVESLASNQQLKLVFQWDTSEMNTGNYTLKATATTTPDSHPYPDSTFIGEAVLLRAASSAPIWMNLAFFLNILVGAVVTPIVVVIYRRKRKLELT